MRGLDGNYINTQGDASTRMQVAYQAEVNRQQMKAQLESLDALRKLREQVNEAEKGTGARSSKIVGDDQGSDSQAFDGGGESGEKKSDRDGLGALDGVELEKMTKTHIDIRV